MKNRKGKVIIILGPTSAGKTGLAVSLAKKFNGEIISADSRQVYRGMDIGTGKDLAEYDIKKSRKQKNNKAKVERVPYHLIDVKNPKGQFTVAEFQRLAYKAIDDILAREKTPIVCGGTGLYISALVEGYVLPETQSSKLKAQNSRQKLDKLSLKQLLVQLKKIDLKTYKIIDKNNRRRVQRALEIFYETGKTKSSQLKTQKPPYQFLQLGMTFPREILVQRIEKRLKHRIEKEGMIKEVERLHRQGVSWQRLESFGLEYRFVSRYLRGQLKYEEMFLELKKAISQFAKRQMTWFKRDKNIKWLKNYQQAEELIKKFI